MASYTTDVTDPTPLAANETVVISSGAVVTITSSAWSANGLSSLNIANGELNVVNTSTTTGLAIKASAVFSQAIGTNGVLRATGNWIELGVGNGSAGKTVNFWTDVWIPCVWVETASGSGVYEIYLNLSPMPGLSNRMAVPLSAVGSGEMGRFFTQAGATLTFGDGTHGKIPPSGAKIRAPNILFHCTTTAMDEYGVYSCTQLFTNTANRGRIILDKMLFGMGWGFNPRDAPYNMGAFNHLQSPSELVLKNVGHGTGFSLSNVETAPTIENCGFVQGVSAAANLIALSKNFDTVTFKNCAAWMPYSTGTAVDSLGPLWLNQVCDVVWDGGWLGFSKNTFAANNQAQLIQVSSTTYPSSPSTWKLTIKGGAELFGGSVGCAGYLKMDKVTMLHDVTRSEATQALTNSGEYPIRMKTSQEAIIDINDLTIPANCGWSNSLIQSVSGVVEFKASKLNIQSANMEHVLTPGASAIYKSFSLTDSFIKGWRTRFISENSSATLLSNITIQNVRSDKYDQAFRLPASKILIKGLAMSGIEVPASSITSFDSFFIEGYTGATTGLLGCTFCTKTSFSNDYFVFTGAAYLDAKTLQLPQSSSVEIIWPHKVVGVTGFRNLAPVYGGTSVNFASQVTLAYSINTGTGWGPWTAATGANLSAETVSAADGFFIKFRFTNSSATWHSIGTFYVPTNVDQTVKYPLSFSTLTLTGLQPDSEVRVYDASTGVELGGSENTGTSFSLNYEYPGSDFPVDIVIHHLNYIYLRLPAVVLGAEDTTIPIQQQRDRNYLNPS